MRIKGISLAPVGTARRTMRWGGLVTMSLWILLGASTPLHAQGVRYDNIVLGPRGGPVASANIAVCSAGASTGATPCSPLATIYSDEALTQPMANPMHADSLGNYGFWAAPGHYVVQIYGTGLTTRTMNVFLPCDPSNCSMSNATISSISAGTLNLTGSLTVNGRGVATKPLASDAVIYVSPNGSDSNDGLSWGTAKQTLYAAVEAMVGASGGTIYIAANSACGGPVSGQGLWLTNGSSPGSGWIVLNNHPLNFVGAGNTAWAQDATSPAVTLNCGSATQPALELQNTNDVPLHFSNLIFTGSMGADLATSVVLARFDNVQFKVNDSVAGNGPAVFIGSASFWIYFNHCVFFANDNTGKTPGAEAAQAMVIDPDTPTVATSNLIFIDNSLSRNGSIEYKNSPSDAASQALTVNGLTTENQTDGHGAVWINNTNQFTSFSVSHVGVADASTNPTPALEVDAGTPSAVVASDLSGYGVNYTGPATILNTGYPNNVQNETEIPYAAGEQGFLYGRFWGQYDGARRLFGPVASRFTNLAHDASSGYVAWYGTPSYASVAAPDGTNNAVQLSGGSSAVGVFLGATQPNVSNGDYLIGGAWVRDPNGSGGYPNGYALIVQNGCSATMTPLTPDIDSSGQVGGNYIAAGSSGEWEWWSFAVKLEGLSGTTSCYLDLGLQAAANQSMDVYAPVLYYVPSSTISDSEASYIALNLASYPDGLTPPVEATLRGHPFAFGGSGDSYFATLDHTTLTANRTYSLPNTNGTVCLTTTCGGQVGQLSISSATSASHSFGSPYQNPPICVVSPSSNPGSVTWWVTSSTSSVTVTLSASSTVTFNFSCFGNPD